MQPTEWARIDDSAWRVTLRCPECYRGHAVTLTQDQVTEFSHVVEEGFRCLLEVLDRLDHEAFESECELIISALRGGNLYPMDF